jgi:hypothetical protein
MPYHSDEDDAMGKVCNYVTLLTFLVALLTKLDYIKRVFVTQLLLFLLALSVVVFGAVVAAKQLYSPVTKRSLGRRRSSLLNKHLKTMDADAAEITRLRGLSDTQRAAPQPQAKLQAGKPSPASPRGHTDDPRLSRLSDDIALSGRGALSPFPSLPPLPNRHPTHDLYPPLSASPLYAFEEPDPTTSTLSTTFNALLQRATSDDRHSTGRHDQLSSSDNAYASTMRATLRPTPEAASEAAATPPVKPLELLSRTAGFTQDRARADSPAPPLPPADRASI